MVLYTVSMTIGLAALWMALSGYLLPLILAFGAGSVLFALFMASRMNLLDDEGHPIKILGRALLFYPWLQGEIVKANLDVSKAILWPKNRVKPKVIRAKATQKTELGHVIHANSITLTPGTVTIAVEDGVLTVHALTVEAANGVLTGDMDKRCGAVEGSAS